MPAESSWEREQDSTHASVCVCVGGEGKMGQERAKERQKVGEGTAPVPKGGERKGERTGGWHICL